MANFLTKRELHMPLVKSKGSYLAILSDTSLDRDDEMIGKSALLKAASQDGFLPALIDHKNEVEGLVAKWVNKRVEEIDGSYALVAEPEFFKSNPRAQTIKGMLDEGAEIDQIISAIENDQ